MASGLGGLNTAWGMRFYVINCIGHAIHALGKADDKQHNSYEIIAKRAGISKNAAVQTTCLCNTLREL